MQIIPEMMTAIEISKPGGPEVLKPVIRPVPTPKPDEVLIKVSAAGVNRPDILQRSGFYPPPAGASDLPGLEISGQIVSSGNKTKLDKGLEVCALTNGGGYAEYCVAPEAQTLPIPKGLSITEAACMPETFFTVWSNLYDRGNLQSGERLLVHGGSSGIGTTAIQLASHFGAEVLTTCGSEKKCNACITLGAKSSINYKKSDFVKEVEAITNGEGVDVILDMVGGSYIEKNLKLLRYEGRLIQIAFLEGPKININMLPIMLKRLILTGSTLRPQSTEAKGKIAKALQKKVWPSIASGKIKPLIDREFELTDASKAHEYMESGKLIGKTVLVV
tara:strand:+ start:400 stop:1395 length:996 start_codon:yes stop_codon:yes gene_type:complete